MASDEHVQLNVSGVTQDFFVLKSLLRKDPDSYLARLNSELLPIKKNEKDEILVSRNPRPFLRVLDYLRNDKPVTIFVNDEQEEQELRTELDYLCVSLRPETKFQQTQVG